MPSIDLNLLLKLKENYTNYNCFVETGTYQGETIFNLEPYFTKLITIEFDNILFNHTKNRYIGNKIDFILGDSSDVFKTLLPKINTNTIFFLDGHYSGGITGRSLKDCPLIEEITCINELFNDEAILIIDDYRLFGQYIDGINWSNITKTEILNILNTRIKYHYHLESELDNNDRLIIHIFGKNK
jgi:hypothetical protein